MGRIVIRGGGAKCDERRRGEAMRGGGGSVKRGGGANCDERRGGKCDEEDPLPCSFGCQSGYQK